MIVADTNVIVYLSMQSEKSSLAAQAFEKDNQWVAPLVWQSEFLNVLALHLRKGIISFQEACQILGKTRELLQLEYQVVPESVLKLVVISKCSAYDCEFIALAQELDIRLLTEDKQILEQFPETAINLSDFLKE
jgi:predicted nucleic acid-binding protein